jgi:hypothetical protein
LAKVNYKHEKRQRDLAKIRKKEEKKQSRLQKNTVPPAVEPESPEAV